jgi:hypothetical protein
MRQSRLTLCLSSVYSKTLRLRLKRFEMLSGGSLHRTRTSGRNISANSNLNVSGNSRKRIGGARKRHDGICQPE